MNIRIEKIDTIGELEDMLRKVKTYEDNIQEREAILWK